MQCEGQMWICSCGRQLFFKEAEQNISDSETQFKREIKGARKERYGLNTQKEKELKNAIS